MQATSPTSPNTTTEEDFEDNDSIVAEDEENDKQMRNVVSYGVGETQVSFTQNPLSDTFSYYEPGEHANTKQGSENVCRGAVIRSWFQKLREKDLIIPSMTTITLLLIMACLIVIVVAVTAPFKDITTVNVVDIMSYRSSLLAAHVSMKGFTIQFIPISSTIS
ncbi:predicted protein [Naegleria gruberi]|uniref:Predicted protein n=1 Tax=Naegleria gruberi TaxID=5762 RepID=D2VLF6_NAEGR|nr:uncharacterized protein NAEGRDRAFT_69762 [Naegleria gruberi]EFC42303.1 predicted protein [Naegleria gruberi]|eukprot:XP_002675047.1 predicted protein [Naegleria gruberi strain NEG-M]